MQIRQARVGDIQALVGLGVEGLQLSEDPRLVIDRDKLVALARECVSGASNYCWVVEDDDGEIVGAISALVHDMLMHQRRQATVVQWYCKVPPYGVYLLRRFLAWARSRRVIKMIVFDGIGDDSAVRVLQACGVCEAQPAYVEVR